MQAVAFGVDRQWDAAVWHWELYLVTYDTAWWRIMWEKECMFVCVTGSICCTVENWQNTVNILLWLQSNLFPTAQPKLLRITYFGFHHPLSHWLLQWRTTMVPLYNWHWQVTLNTLLHVQSIAVSRELSTLPVLKLKFFFISAIMHSNLFFGGGASNL